MGIQLGIGKKKKVIIKVIRGYIKFSIITTRKSCILKEYISINSNIVPPLLLLKGKTY